VLAGVNQEVGDGGWILWARREQVQMLVLVLKTFIKFTQMHEIWFVVTCHQPRGLTDVHHQPS